jgi:hypothetical protein
MISILTKWRPIVLVTSALAFVCCAPCHASTRTFGGYDCTDGCVGHAAGYRWAEERGIDDIDKCPDDRSEAFYEGCLTYVDDPERGADFDDDGELILVPRRASEGSTMDVTGHPDMVGTMYKDTTALERAFQLASSGDHGSIDDIKRRLRTEGYSDTQIMGGTLSKQLRALIRSARNAKARSGPPT